MIKQVLHKSMRGAAALAIVGAAVFGLGAMNTGAVYAADAEETAVENVLTQINSAVSTYLTSKGVSATPTIGDGGGGALYRPETLKAAISIGESKVSKVDLSEASLDSKTISNYADDIWNVVKTQLLADGFVAYEYNVLGTDEYINTTSGVICNARSTALSTAEKGITGVVMVADCAHTNWWTLANGWTEELVNGLGQAYYNKKGEYPLIITRDQVPEIEDSEVQPYQRIAVPISNFAGLFYRVSPTSSWVYFTGTQSTPLCSEYTGDAILAYYGEVCYDSYDTGSMSTVGASTAAAETEDANSAFANAPNTGIFGDEDGGAGRIVVISAVVMAGIAVVAFFVRYGVKRVIDYRAVRFTRKK